MPSGKKGMMKHSRNARISKFSIVITVLVLIVTTFVLLIRKDGNKSHSISDPLNQKWNRFDFSVQLNPSVEFINGTDLIWQIPTSPKGILFLAHGCSCKAANFWDKSLNCPHCIGLPEDRAIVLHALARKFAVLAISSKGNCWSLEDEISAVKQLIQWWISKQNLENVPVFALGASSGGYFVSALAMEFTFRAIALMISEGVYSQLQISKSYPSVLFVHMPKDEWRKRKIEKYIVALRDKGIDVDEIKCMEFPLTPQLFSDRIPQISLKLSVKLFEIFKEKGFIDENGFMRDDGRSMKWKGVLEEEGVHLLDKSLMKHVQEEMNGAFAYHEMTSLPSEQIFNWFESHMSSRFW